MRCLCVCRNTQTNLPKILWTTPKKAYSIKSAKLVFTEQILNILHLIYDIAVHSQVFILDLPTNEDLWNLYYLFLLTGKWVVFCLFDWPEKCGNAWQLHFYDGLWITEKKKNILAEMYIPSLRNIYILCIRFHKYFFLWIPTRDRIASH
jgi:hypothetical protein